MIPKIIHQIWLSDSITIPKQYAEMSKSWAKFNPDFEHIVWDERVYDEFGGKEYLFEKYHLDGVHPAQVSDIMRLKLIQKYGGLYTDIDCECFQSIEPLLVNEFVGYCYGYTSDKVLISFESFAAIPDQRIVNRVLDLIEYHINDVDMSLLWKFGFRRFQDTIITEMSNDITIYGPVVIAPYWKHHFYNSWI
jgi:mannosyltransferase OCH1-like enzyme